MDQKKFESMLVLLVPQVVQLITENYLCDEITASKEFYVSEVYELLEQEDTKLWHLSALTLFHMFDEEKRTGIISFPEEA
ncbi:MAG: hypothetical protein HDQ97_13060 [Lachnospiraceae bacterium]|nr:hypothetical protein [Lachnospiraceae bacterium]